MQVCIQVDSGFQSLADRLGLLLRSGCRTIIKKKKGGGIWSTLDAGEVLVVKVAYICNKDKSSRVDKVEELLHLAVLSKLLLEHPSICIVFHVSDKEYAARAFFGYPLLDLLGVNNL